MTLSVMMTTFDVIQSIWTVKLLNFFSKFEMNRQSFDLSIYKLHLQHYEKTSTICFSPNSTTVVSLLCRDERSSNVFLFRFSISKSAIKYGAELKRKLSPHASEGRLQWVVFLSFLVCPIPTSSPTHTSRVRRVETKPTIIKPSFKASLFCCHA